MAEGDDTMPVPKATRKNRPGMLVIWAVLGGLAVSLYWITRTRGASTTGVLAIVALVLGALLVMLLASPGITRRRLRRALVELDDGEAALSCGQLAIAHDTFQRWCESPAPMVAAIARHDLGWTLMRQGRLESALAVVSDNDAVHARELDQLRLHATSSADLALYSALLGKLEQAESWMEITARRATVGAVSSLPAMKVFARAVLDCRQERFDDAARLLDEQWAECEAGLKGSELRALRVVRAYADAARGPRASGSVDAILASSRPTYAGEYDFLGTVWPEMQRFLVTHRLSTAS